ncbi:MAG: hypothetical protein MJY49_04175 [Bacteroidales bacterium]|nr:hypothetical protein [Bacteroidales bacterium]
MVKELLADTGVAVIPGFGRFVVEDVPACFSDRGFTLNPPYRSVTFSLSKDSDNALASIYASSNNVDLRRAEEIVRDYVSALKAELSSSRTVVLPSFGQLRQAGLGCIVFVPDESLSIFPQFDLLSPLSLKSRNFTAADASSVSVVPETRDVPAESVAPGHSGELPKIWTAVIAVAVVLVMLLLALAVLGRLAPDLIDPLLYDADQLEILHKTL